MKGDKNLGVPSESLIMNRSINSEAESPHFLNLSYIDYPPPTRLKTSTFAANMSVQT
jgi:hypothetical protein